MSQPLSLVLALFALALASWWGWHGARERRRERSAATAETARLQHQLDEQHALIEHAQADRAAAQAEARANEERLAVALRGSQDGLWEWELDNNRVQLSPRWKSMLGFTPDELPDDLGAWRARVHPADRDGLDAAVQRHLSEVRNDAEARFDHELRLLHKDGSVRWVLSRGVALRRANGTPYRMVGFDNDITRLKHVLVVLDAVAAGTSGAWGEAFFVAMVEHFARALDVDLAFVTECADYPTTRLRTLAVWSVDGPRANFEFDVTGTPCEAVVQRRESCFHRSGVGKLHPRDAAYDAYLGLPIIASDGRLLGHLAFFDRGPRGDEMLVETIYRIFLARAAAEMERMQALARLHDAQQRSAPAPFVV
jgi:PAS domain S-box-containing protein